jgi:hypothetical protein
MSESKEWLKAELAKLQARKEIEKIEKSTARSQRIGDPAGGYGADCPKCKGNPGRNKSCPSCGERG